MRVTYFRDGKVVVLRNSDAVPLRYGGSICSDMRWAVPDEVFKLIVQDNPNVEFAEVTKPK